jgi:hypothetical protein
MRIVFVSLTMFLFGCSKEDVVAPKKEFALSIDSVLTQSGMSSLPKDKN